MYLENYFVLVLCLIFLSRSLSFSLSLSALLLPCFLTPWGHDTIDCMPETNINKKNQ